MDSFEIEFLNKFNSRHSLDHGDEAWIQKAMSFLGEILSSQGEDYEKASSLLASSKWSKEGLNTLAYASFCFWHRPLAIPKYVFSFGPGAAAWMANSLMASLVCQKELREDGQTVWEKVTHRLALACVALKAVSLREDSEQGKVWSFQAEMLKVLPQRLAEEPYLIEAAQKWPAREDICSQDEQNSRPPISFEEAFSSIDLKGVSEKAAEIFCRTADELSSKDFSGVSSVRTFFPKEGKGRSGSYDYSDGKGYLVIPDTFWDCMLTLPAFLAFTVHEVLHMHQIRSMEKNPDPFSPLYAEHLTRQMDLKVRDFSCQTFSVQGDHARNAEIPIRAYLYRPQEFFAHKFGGAFQKVLAKIFGTSFVKPCFNTGYDEFARSAGVEVEPDEPERLKSLPNRNISFHSLQPGRRV